MWILSHFISENQTKLLYNTSHSNIYMYMISVHLDIHCTLQNACLHSTFSMSILMQMIYLGTI